MEPDIIQSIINDLETCDIKNLDDLVVKYPTTRYALTSMGTFQHPLEDSLKGLTYAEWKNELIRRVVVSVLKDIVVQLN